MSHRAKFLALLLLLFTASVLRADYPGLSYNLSGRWAVTISTPTGKILGLAELTQSGNQVSGWFEPNNGDRIPISGSLILGKLVLTTHPESRHYVAFDRCEINAGGNRMKGRFYPGNGKIEFFRYREPHLPSSPRAWHPFGEPSVR